MLLVIADHPIQYQGPVFRQLAQRLDGHLTVLFKNVQMGNGAIDPDFGIPVKWDTPVLSGYRFSSLDDAAKPLHDVVRNLRPWAMLLTLSYTDPVAWEAIIAARKFSIPVIWRFEGNDRDNGRSKLKSLVRSRALTILYREVSAFLSIGEACDQHLLNHGVQRERIFRSPYNVDDQLFESMRIANAGERETARASLGIQESDFVFIVVGKLIARKNPQVVIRALRRIPEKWIRVMFVGTGPLEAELREEAEKSCQGRVIFGGFANQTALGRLYAAVDGALLPSRFETWGLVVNEAQHFSLPVVVSSNVGSHPDLITDGETGWVFSDNDASDLASKLRLVATDKMAAKRMGESGYCRIQNYTTASATAGIMEALRFTSPQLSNLAVTDEQRCLQQSP